MPAFLVLIALAVLVGRQAVAQSAVDLGDALVASSPHSVVPLGTHSTRWRR
jgi:hypothetical protein